MLEVKNLKTGFLIKQDHFLAVDDVSFSVQRGRTLGLVGESGCGKSVTSLSIMGLIQAPGKIEDGQVLFEGEDILKFSEQKMRQTRGHKIAMIFQDPMSSLNPVFTCGEQIKETIRLHHPGLSQKQIEDQAIEILKIVGMPSAEQKMNEYPHQLSGGMRQRVAIAMAMSCRPKLLIADEPTSALDVTIQAQILDLMRNLQKKFSTAMLLITHDLAVVAQTCDDVVVMYAGKIIESGSVEDLFYRPRHPYTRGLLDSLPNSQGGQKKTKLKSIPGIVPAFLHLVPGCRFYERCNRRQDLCTTAMPPLETPTGGSNHKVACYFPLSGGPG